jgi:cobaltochelatase CobT
MSKIQKALRSAATVQRFAGLDRLRSLVLVAWAFGRSTGVKIAIGGDRAFTDGETVTIPAVDENNPRAMQLVWGYLAHEAGHVRFTQFDDLERMAAEGRPLLRAVWNILEDVRIENAMIAVYPGTRSTMDAAVQSILQKDDWSVSEHDSPTDILVNSLLILARHQYRNQAFLESLAKNALVVLRKAFPSPFVLRLMGLMCDISALGSTEDAIALARRILQLIEDEASTPEPELQPQSEPEREAEPNETSGGDTAGESGDQSSESDGESAGTGESGEDSPESNGESAGSGQSGEDREGSDESQSQPSTGGAGAGDGEEEQDGASEDGQHASAESSGDNDQTDTSGKGGESEDGAGGDSDPQSGESGGSSHGQEDRNASGDEANGHNTPDGAGGASQAALRAVLDADESDLPDDLFGAVKRELEGAAQRSLDGRSLNLLPKALPFEGSRLHGERRYQAVRGESRRLTTQLHGIVQAETMTRHRTARRGRRLSKAHLHRAAVGDDRIFAKSDQRRAPNTAIHLVVDMSGSMSPPLCDLAMEAAMALALALEPIKGVSTAVTAFPHVDLEFNAVTEVLRRGQSVRPHAGAFVQAQRGGTPLTEALWFCAAELLAADEPRKVAIVLTDGDPYDAATAADIVQRMDAAGVEIIGIGIGHDASWLFPNHLMIFGLGQLKHELIGVARQLLIT